MCVCLLEGGGEREREFRIKGPYAASGHKAMPYHSTSIMWLDTGEVNGVGEGWEVGKNLSYDAERTIWGCSKEATSTLQH